MPRKKNTNQKIESLMETTVVTHVTGTPVMSDSELVTVVIEETPWEHVKGLIKKYFLRTDALIMLLVALLELVISYVNQDLSGKLFLNSALILIIRDVINALQAYHVKKSE